MYKKPLDELGIDIGIDQNRKLWIYEVNWRPGYIYRELDAAMRLIPYTVYLAKNMNSESNEAKIYNCLIFPFETGGMIS